jgi:hypothetical protein
MYQFVKFGGGGGTAERLGPWDLFTTTPENQDPNQTPDPNKSFVKVIPGLVGGILPTNWNDIFEVNNQNITYFNVQVTVDGEYRFGPSEIKIETTPPNTPIPVEAWNVSGPILINFGVFSQGVSYRTIKNGDIVLASILSLTTSDDTDETVPFTNYYRIINI